jgi:beta-N-acetylhexosaminidase
MHAPFLFIDIKGFSLAKQEEVCLIHPYVVGVVLFARNYESPEQLLALTTAIKSVRPKLQIAIDQEGGRVQRLRDSFTLIPPMGEFGRWYADDPDSTLSLLKETAWLVGAELKAMHIDINFAPVLDRDLGVSQVIGDRAFDAKEETIVTLASAYIKGLSEAGVLSVGKHFPGHGAVVPDSHKELPVDGRSYQEIAGTDMRPFDSLISQHMLPAVMMSHVVYSDLDAKPAGFSSAWVTGILRNHLKYKGLIFTDDLSMEAARSCGDLSSTIELSLASGCDRVLVCNYKQDMGALLDSLEQAGLTPVKELDPLGHFALGKEENIAWSALTHNERYQAAKRALEERKS